jgi:hypothetical protein
MNGRGEKRLQGFGGEARGYFKDQGVDGMMGSKGTSERLAVGGVLSGFEWLRIGTVGWLS